MSPKHTFSSLDNSETTSSSLTATCPSCEHTFPVGESILLKLRQQAESEFTAWKAKHEQELDSRARSLQQKEAKLQEEQGQQAKLVEDRVSEEVSERLKTQYPELLKQARVKAQQEADQRMLALQTDLEAKSQEVNKLYAQQAALEKSQRELTAEKSRFELDKQRAISDALSKEREALRLSIDQDFQEKFQIQNLELERARRQIDELHQRLKSKPSQEAQGEALEWDLESKLRDSFQTDEFTPVKKGQRGADLLQGVQTRYGNPSGTILWETKRAQNWSGDWITKLKEDQREARATVGVIVSQVTPSSVESFGMIDGVWVVKPEYASALAVAIREGLLQTADARKAAEGQETKAALVYGYLMSDEFKARFGAIVETFVEMQKQLQKEKNAATRSFNLREKQHETVLKSCFGMMGDLQGIAGQDLQSLAEIELKALPASEEVAA